MLDWKLVDDIQTVLQVSTSRTYILWYQNHDRTWVLASVSNYCNPDAHHKIYPPRWDLSYKNSTTELVHSRYFVLCATFPRAEVWNPLAEHEPLLPVEMSVLWLVMGTTATYGSKKITMTWHDVVASTKNKRHGNIWKKNCQAIEVATRIFVEFFFLNWPSQCISNMILHSNSLSSIK